MSDQKPNEEEAGLIPIPPIVRAALAENIKEGRLLRSLLRLSVKADEVRGYGTPNYRPPKAKQPGGSNA
jgi:hypothetical protein